MKGIFRKNPPRPKLCTTWKVQVALAYMNAQKPVGELSLKDLSYKLVLLLGLALASRAHELAALDLKYQAVRKRILGNFLWPFTSKSSSDQVSLVTWSEDDFIIKSKYHHFTFVSYITRILSLQDDTIFRNMFYLIQS